MKFKNGLVGLRIVSKSGMHDQGRIERLNTESKTFGIVWLLQDGQERSRGVDPKDVRKAPELPKCSSCGKEL